MVAKDKAAQTSLSCQRLEENVTRFVTEREDLRGQLEGVSQGTERGVRQREKYRKKMEAHRDRVSQAEQDSSAHRELTELQAQKKQPEEKRKFVRHFSDFHAIAMQHKYCMCVVFRITVSPRRRTDDTEW